MEVPSIDEITSAFGAAPVSTAEVGFGRFLPLSDWPDGEILVQSEVAGRVATVLLSPSTDTVTIRISAPDEIARVTVRRAQRVSIRPGSQITRLVVESLGGEFRVVSLRLKPDIRLAVGVAGD